MDPSDPAYAGQKDYGPFLLSIYDWWVLGVMARAVWWSPVQPMVDCYRSAIGPRHLDVGPGSGYFLDVAAPERTDITLLDPNTDVLEHCTKRLARFRPSAVEADVLKPLPVAGPFDSVAISAVLHCLPGPMESKGRAFRNAAAVLVPDGVLFGATVLGLSEEHSAPARAFLKMANKQGAFDNLSDTGAGLESILSDSFEEVEIDVSGSLALFTARNPRGVGSP